MAKEIERKFLLANDAWRASAVRRRGMRQGYVASGERISVRVRISGEEAWLNIKCGGLTAARDEYEYSVPLVDAQELLAAVRDRPIVTKTRHYVPHEGFEWEIDEFHGANAGLIVAEIELDDLGQELPLPPWVGAEVTHLLRYYNVNLARHPYSAWTEEERNA